MNNNFRKALCISAICIFLVANISYADTNYTKAKKHIKILEKQIKDFEKNNCNDKEKYSENLSELTDIHLFLNNPERAIEFLNKKETFIIQNEDKNSIQLVPILLKKAEIYSFMVINEELVNNNLKKAYEIIQMSPNNEDAKLQYFQTLTCIAREKDEQYRALEQLKIQENFNKLSAITKFYIKLNLSETYGVLKDFQNAKKSLNEAYKIAIKEYNNGNKYTLYDYYISLINFYKYKLEYNNAINTYNKLNKLLQNDKDVAEQVKHAAIYSLAGVQKEFKYYNELEKYIEDNKKSAIDNDTNQKNLYSLQIDYYFDTGNFEEYKNILTKQKKLHKKYTNKHLIRDLYAQEKLANYYEKTGKIDKAIKIVQQDIERLESYKEGYPGVYGFKLKELSDLYKENNDIDKAIETYEEAITYTETIFPNNSYRRIEELKEMSELHIKKKDYKKAFEYANTAVKIINELNVEKTTGALDIYNCLYEIYFDTGNIKKAEQTINKIIKISEEIYGKNHTKTMDQFLKKSYLLAISNKAEERNEMLKKIENTNISGYDYDFLYNFYNHLARKNLGLNNELAIKYAFKAKENAKEGKHKKAINELFSEVYKSQGKKLKALQYKLK